MALRTRVFLLAVSIYLCSAVSAAFNRAACQYPTSDPLEGCASNTLLVGSSTHANFSSVQSAILSLPNDTTAYTILIEEGNYTEQLNVTHPGPVTLLGQTSAPTERTQNRVAVFWAAVAGTGDNAYTSVLTVAPTLNASLTGSGPNGNAVPPGTPFGNVDFRVYNVDFVNDYAPYSDGPSLAVSVSYANSGFYYSGFYSYQDTIYIGKLGNAYFYGSEIAGQTDFFYGFGTAWINSSLVTLRGCGGGITAWKGTNTTFENKYGVYIHESTVRKANNSLDIAGECALGRPWNAQMRAIFANDYLDDSIRPSGYIEWQSTDPRIDYNTTMAEFYDVGPGFNLTGRLEAGLTWLMTPEEYEPYSSAEKVFQYPFNGTFGNVAWIDFEPWQ
ncbi:carbohydrate esterase family 8 protein [Laetiporus sulphureus 93-53]|uniref:pectinesterase n=1 Tax=Laetiporus sulphureus 93-53 TaxID=1314785 RepID=A0A165B287_9APHY|nr:carbohydrate esterase family 8 protein [Laetiporus sulphureus 93-53]KZT00091.1 carbohydrate esterase family 8 protein [Laetiporus sulphureus 93-53]